MDSADSVVEGISDPAAAMDTVGLVTRQITLCENELLTCVNMLNPESGDFKEAVTPSKRKAVGHVEV